MNSANPALPAQIVDALCLDYEQKKTAADAATKALTEAKAALIDRVQQLGYVPAGADKSVRLDGINFVATVTTASTIDIVDASVVELQLALSLAKKSRLFRLLFDRRVKYSLAKNAAETLKAATATLPEEAQKRFAQLFASCFGVGTKAPSLSVDTSASVKAKEAKAAKKAAKKAARA